MITKDDCEWLIQRLRLHCPVDTGNLKNNGIGGVQSTPQGYVVQIGFPASVQGNPPTQSYALYTHIKNKSSKGWVDEACMMWAKDMQPIFEAREESDVNYDVIF